MTDRPRKRSWLSIRLRTLLLLTLASGCILGLIGREVRQARRREEAARELARAASKIDIEYCNFWGRKVNELPPAWQRRLLGEHYFQRVTALEVSNPSELADEGRLIGELRDLRSFELRGSHLSAYFTDGHAKAFSRLRELENVRLPRAQITDEAALCLSPDNPLKSLDLQQTLVGDAGLEHIAQFQSLEWLNLSQTLVTDGGLKHLAQLPRLRCLHLRRVMVSDEGLRELLQCKSLETVTLGELPFSFDVLSEIARMPNLEDIYIGDIMVRSPKTALNDLRRVVSRHAQASGRDRPANVFWAIDRDHCPRNTPYLQWLLEHGADPDAQKGGITAASILAGRGAVEPVAVLLDFGATLNPARRMSWQSPLAAAAQRGQLEIVRFLLDRGADPNLPDSPALVYAAWGAKPEVIRLVIGRGADANRVDPTGVTPLTAGMRNADVVRALLESGADPNVADGEGKFPLHAAAEWGNLEAVKLLLRYGADATKRNAAGELPYAVTMRSRDQSQTIHKIAELLKVSVTPGEATPRGATTGSP